jgi:hypothetical protein
MANTVSPNSFLEPELIPEEDGVCYANEKAQNDRDMVRIYTALLERGKHST